MSIRPAVRDLTLYEGSTFDVTLTFYTDEAETLPKDFTGWGAAMKVRKAYGEPVLLEVASGALTPGPTAKAIALGGEAGTARIYVGSTHMAALTRDSFTAVLEDGETFYRGRWDLELTNPAGEVFRYVMGAVELSPEVTE